MKASLMVASGIIAMAIVALAVLGTVWGLGQTASAGNSVTLKHIEPDGTDYPGNPYCPQTVWTTNARPLTVDPRHDCNNITSQKHVIRTDGFDEAKVPAGAFQFNKEGVGTLVGMDNQGVRCGDLTLLTSRAGWDDQCDDADDDDDDDADKYVNDGCAQMGATAETGAECGDGVTLDITDDDADTVVNDGCPARGLNVGGFAVSGVSEDLGDQRCLVIHSMVPGETSVTFTYSYFVNGESAAECTEAPGAALDDDQDGVVNDVCPDDLLVSVETLADCDGGDIPVIVDDKWWVGDANRNFDKDAVDALFILQYVVGMRDGSDQCPPPPGAIHLPSADADCDGDVDAVDALFVLQHVVGLRPVLCPTS